MRFEGSAFGVRHTQYSIKSDYGSSIDILFFQTDCQRTEGLSEDFWGRNVFRGNSCFCQKNETLDFSKFWTVGSQSWKFSQIFQRNLTKMLQTTFVNLPKTEENTPSPIIFLQQRSWCALSSFSHPWAALEVLIFLFMISVVLSPQRRGFAHSSWDSGQCVQGWGIHVPKTSSRKSWMPQVSVHPLVRETPGALLWSALSWRNNSVPVDQIPPHGTGWDYFCHSTEVQTRGGQTAVGSWCHQAGLAAAKSGFFEGYQFYICILLPWLCSWGGILSRMETGRTWQW